MEQLHIISTKNNLKLAPEKSFFMLLKVKVLVHDIGYSTIKPHTYFPTKFRTTFNFIEVFTDDKPDNCATIIQNSTTHVATLPTGHNGYIEVPITNEKPKYYRVSDINTLNHNVTHAYHPEITEPIPQTNFSVSPNNDTSSTTQFSLHQV